MSERFTELGIDNETGEKIISVLEKMEDVVDDAIYQLEHLEAHGVLPIKTEDL